MLSKVIRRNIKRIRTRAKLTQSEVAAKAGVSLGHYNKIESLGTNLTIETIESIAGALEVHVSELFRGVAPPAKAENIREAIRLLEELV